VTGHTLPPPSGSHAVGSGKRISEPTACRCMSVAASKTTLGYRRTNSLELRVTVLREAPQGLPRLVDMCWGFAAVGSRGGHLWQNHLRKGFVTRINLSDSRWSENTINIYKYNIIYWSSSRNYYNLGSHISYIEEVWSQHYASKDKSEFAEVISLNGQNILFALKENVIHRRSKPERPSIESNPHRFGLPTDNPHRHRR
jgi:hypothetical protein